MADNDVQRRASPTTVEVGFDQINDLTTCFQATFTWTFNPPTGDTEFAPPMRIAINSINDPDSSSKGIPHDDNSVMTLTTTVPATAESYTWKAVAVPEGQYYLAAVISDTKFGFTASSNPFQVFNGSDVSCLSTSSSSSTTGGTSSTSGNPSQTSSSPSPSATTSTTPVPGNNNTAASSKSLNTGAIAGGTIAAFLVLSFVLCTYIYLARKSRRGSSSRRAQLAGGGAAGILGFPIGKSKSRNLAEEDEGKASSGGKGAKGWKGAKWNGLGSVDLASTHSASASDATVLTTAAGTAISGAGKNNHAHPPDNGAELGMAPLGYHRGRSTTTFSSPPSVSSTAAPSPEPYANDSYYTGGRQNSISQSILSSSQTHYVTSSPSMGGGGGAGAYAYGAGGGTDDTKTDDLEMDSDVGHSSSTGHGYTPTSPTGRKRSSTSSSVVFSPISPTSPTSPSYPSYPTSFPPPANANANAAGAQTPKKKTPRKPVPTYDATSTSASATASVDPASPTQMRARSKSVAQTTSSSSSSATAIPMSPTLSHGHYTTKNAHTGAADSAAALGGGKDVHYLIPDMPVGYAARR